ncbi:DUF6461 domain-containing protein [Frankia sp. Ag45/Mut15]|uniref:DUF6461 domain-containing protein n=1 Tax=Frankia umida TaxID=573489 RepID=A0ABT0K448_9ACTN|nr:DUF6461 domain-containing protein [Frankia umida]MCK9878307.1 DUF6461 domain-containing protein [Frankia umida]
MSEIDAVTMAVVVRWVLEVAPTLAERIPAPVATVVGRLGATPGAARVIAARSSPGQEHGPRLSVALAALEFLGEPLGDRLLGAVELSLAKLEAELSPPRVAAVGMLCSPEPRSVFTVDCLHDLSAGSATRRAAGRLDQQSPHTAVLITELVGRVAADPAVTAVLGAVRTGDAVAGTGMAGGGTGWGSGLAQAASALGPQGWPGQADGEPGPAQVSAPEFRREAEIAAGHGLRALALALAVAAMTARHADGSPHDAATVVGVGLAAAALHLAEAPMPVEYAAALLERRRQLYLLPRTSHGHVRTHGHVFGLLEVAHTDDGVTLVPAAAAAAAAAAAGTGSTGISSDVDAPFAANGLVAVVSGGLLVRTGQEAEHVSFTLRILADPPSADMTDAQLRTYDEIVEMSWRAEAGSAVVTNVSCEPTPAGWGDLVDHRDPTPPWPGDYRVRVAAAGRDHADDHESYELLVWSAPPAAPVVWQHLDRLGHRLRGQHEPAPPPEEKYHWVWAASSVLGQAATVTIVVGTPRDDVVRLFGAEPVSPRSLASLLGDLNRDGWLAAMQIPGSETVVVIEENDFAGTDPQLLAELSRRGVAGSMFWNVNAVTRLSLARFGSLLLSDEVMEDMAIEPELTPLFDGVDLSRWGATVPKGLLVLERFTGHALQPDEVERLWNDELAHRIAR